MLMKELFLEELKKQIGKRYALGAGQMKSYKGYPNFDKNGEPVGFDCCGGIMWALKKATGIKLIMRNVPGMMKAPWLYKIGIDELEESDLIFVDIPAKDENGDVMWDETGYPVYGIYNHVMTYLGNDKIITTKSTGGDFRLNPKSKTITDYWTLSGFKKVSAHIFEDTTQYKYYRISFPWLERWKISHKIK